MLRTRCDKGCVPSSIASNCCTRSVDFRIKPSKVKLFETPILTVKNGITPAVNVKFAWWVNDHTFCATSGEYNPEYHKKMVYGHEANGYKYIGNSAYTSYCEIDLKKFLYSLVWEVLKLKSHTSGNLPSLLVGKVLYDDRVKVISYVGVLPENYNYNDDMIYHAKMAAFSKQPRFEIENEIRIITPLFGFGRTPVDAGPIFFQSNGIKSSILKIGSLE